MTIVNGAVGSARQGSRELHFEHGGPGSSQCLPDGAWHPGMSSRLVRCKIVEMAGSHEVMFTRPADLAHKLTEAAND
jgi:hypothetical protein